MALKTVDLTQQPHRAVFTGCSQEEVSYAKTFWQSFQLLPPMESRLVSSDIKQRLRKAPPSRSMSECSDSHGSDANSLNVTISNSSCHLHDSIKHKNSALFSRPQLLSPIHRHDSLKTQTSLIPNFLEDLENAVLVNRMSDGRDDHSSERKSSYQEAGGGKLSVTFSGNDTRKGFGSKPCVLGAGEETGGCMESSSARKIMPFSGEDPCQRKGFIDWGEQKTMATKAEPAMLECGGEDLRRDRNRQSIGGNRQSSGSNNIHSGLKNKKKGLLMIEAEKAHIKSAKFRVTSPYRNKHQQRVVGTNKLVGDPFSKFISRNIEQPAQSESDTTKKLSQPNARVELGKYTNSIAMKLSSTQYCSTKKEPNSDTRVIKGRRYSQAPLSGTRLESEMSSIQTPHIQFISDAEAVGLPKKADESAVLDTPSTDIVYWTL